MSEASVSPDSGDQRLRLPESRPILTYILLGLIVVIFFAQGILGQASYPRPDPITPWGALDFQRVLAGEYYRLFTSMFLHAGQIHLFSNAASLWIFGRLVEGHFGTLRYGIVYLLTGLTGSLASFALTRGYSVGASGALFGVLGAALMFFYINQRGLGQYGSAQLRYLLTLIAVNFGLGLITEVVPGKVRIDNWGHIGGLVGGLILGWFIAPRFAAVRGESPPFAATLVDLAALEKRWYVPLAYGGGLIACFVAALTMLRGG